MQRAVLYEYRKALIKECEAIGIKLPIRHEIDLKVYFINPTSPDCGNTYLTFEMCLDGKSRKGVITDDGLIGSMDVKKMYV